MQIRTERLVLRGPTPDDLDAMYALYRDPRAMKYWSTPPHQDRAQTKALLDRYIASWQVDPTYFQLTLDGKYIGNVGKHRDDEVGFILHPDHWRQGYIQEAMTALITYLFETTTLERLTAEADPLNIGSIRMLSGLGFTETHRASNTFCINNQWSDSVYFTLPRGDWAR
ncbi:GCN5 family acetyltransferase [Loktanella sp. S4079]|nr:GCN5 family acetyltransferase [Loktanella sp. S4079]